MAKDQVGAVPAFAPIVKESGPSNVRGTIAMSRTSDPNSATNQWFFNTKDNTGLNTVDGGYTVFGKLADAASFKTMDTIAAYRIVNAGNPFAELPVVNTNGSAIDPAKNLVIVMRVALETNFTATAVAKPV